MRALQIALGLLSLAAAPKLAAAQTIHDVTIFDFGFTPSLLVVQTGDFVRFTNTGGLVHTATENQHQNENAAFRAILGQGQSHIVKFNQALLQDQTRHCNTYGYFCEPHPSMVGTIVVEDAVGSSYCTATPNSTGQTARLCANGSSVVSDNNLAFTATRLPAGRFGCLLMSRGALQQPGFGGGAAIQCVAAPFYRLAAKVLYSGENGACRVALDLNELPESQTFLAGETWYFQVLYRDRDLVSPSNTTAGISVTFQ